MWKVEEGIRNLHSAEGREHGVRKEVEKLRIQGEPIGNLSMEARKIK
jgi:hypothetical protein